MSHSWTDNHSGNLTPIFGCCGGRAGICSGHWVRAREAHSSRVLFWSLLGGVRRYSLPVIHRAKLQRKNIRCLRLAVCGIRQVHSFGVHAIHPRLCKMTPLGLWPLLWILRGLDLRIWLDPRNDQAKIDWPLSWYLSARLTPQRSALPWWGSWIENT